MSNVIQVGIIGGVGHSATSLYYSEVARSLLSRGLNFNLSVCSIQHSRDEFVSLITGGGVLSSGSHLQIIRSRIKNAVMSLRDIGAHYISFPCNSYSALFSEICEELGILHTSIEDAIVAAFYKMKPEKVLVLGTSTTINGCMENSFLSSIKDKLIYPCNSTSKLVEMIILDSVSGDLMASLSSLDHFFRSNESELLDASHILLACTDLNTSFKVVGTTEVIDSRSALSEFTAEAIQQNIAQQGDGVQRFRLRPNRASS